MHRGVNQGRMRVTSCRYYCFKPDGLLDEYGLTRDGGCLSRLAIKENRILLSFAPLGLFECWGPFVPDAYASG